MVNQKKVVLISSGQPSANPRLVKEAILLYEAGFYVTVIYCPLSPWADKFDQQLFQLYPAIDWILAGYHPIKQKWCFWFAKLRRKSYHILFKIVGNRFDAAIKSMVLFSQELLAEAKNQKGELYIGHNLGSLPAVVKAAQHRHALASFDFEDFHRGENAVDSMQWRKTKLTEEKYVPFLHFATSASSLITKEYQQAFPKLEFSTINNCFPVGFCVTEPTSLPTVPLKLFWFSQTLGKGRGLEDIIGALKLLPVNTFSLTLLGKCTTDMKLYLNELVTIDEAKIVNITFLGPVYPNEIFSVASHHDIGLALEPGRDINNQIALSNKIFTYLLAGNAVIFSATPAQKLFYEENRGIGSLYSCGNTHELTAILKNYLYHPELLLEAKRNAVKLAGIKYNWEVESKKLLVIIQAALDIA